MRRICAAFGGVRMLLISCVQLPLFAAMYAKLLFSGKRFYDYVL